METIAKWVCECGQETPQPAGAVPVVRACIKCGTELRKIREVDGTHTVFEPALPYFFEEFDKQMREGQQREINLSGAQGQYFQLMYDVIPDLIQKVKNARNKQKNILEKGVKRAKLDRNMSWGYNPLMKCFIGREKPKEVLKDG